MPSIKTKHSLGQADKPPPREALPPGVYSALIMGTQMGVTRTTPPLEKFTVEYRIIKQFEVPDDQAEKYAGRRVYQDYIYETSPTDAEMNAREAFRIRQLLDAADVPYESLPDGGCDFNTDHLANKPVKIHVRQKPGNKKNEDGTFPIYNRVVRVDIVELPNPDAMV